MEDPIEFLWMYYNWAEDISEKHDFTKKYSIFQGSFSNPEMARRFAKHENPTAVMTDKQMDDVMEAISQGKLDKNKKHRRIKKK